MRREKETTYRYKHLELALAEVFGVGMKDLPAFRARIRHLRNLGIPPIGKPGKGQAVTYKRTDAIQLLIALEAELLGLPPQFAAGFSRSAMTGLAKDADLAAQKGGRLVISVDPKFNFNVNDAWIGTVRPDGPLVDGNAHRRMVINLARSISLLDYELRRARGEKDWQGQLTDRFRASSKS